LESVLLNLGWVEGVHVDDNTISSGNYTDGQLRYTGEMNNGTAWTATFDVTNLLDRGPPVIPGLTFTGGQFVDYDYDVFGRRFFISLNASF
jgi:outer membrane receptor protein involved in Fe transport